MGSPTAAKASTATDSAAIASRLRVSATRLARQLRQESEPGLTPSQLSALTSVERHGPLTLGALAEHERVAPPSITKVVTKLEALGVVERRSDDTDRRGVRLAVTPAGDQLPAQLRRRKHMWLANPIADHDADPRLR